MIDLFRKITEEKAWRREAELFLRQKDISEVFVRDFHTSWIEKGHDIRAQIQDDELLVKLLEHVLPKYSGKALILYRGENLIRWEKGSIGLCWTDSIDVARMFGRGLNARDSGSLLLSCDFEADWIISSPNAHSKWLGENEYTVNPFKISNISVLEKYPPFSRTTN